MDYLKKNHLSVVTLVLVGLMFLFGGKGVSLGALDRTTVGNPWTFSGVVTMSGGTTLSGSNTLSGASTFSGSATFDSTVLYSSTFASSSAGAGTYTAANITGVSSIQHDATAALTLTLPATSTLTSMVPNSGDRASVTFVNIGAGAITFAAGTGMDLYNASSTLVLPPTAAAQFEFVRQADTDITVLYVPGS